MIPVLRISRYVHRQGVQQLPIEPIKPVHINVLDAAGVLQRAFASVFIAVRRFFNRPKFTDPEIRAPI